MGRVERENGLVGYFSTVHESIIEVMHKAERFENIDWLFNHGYIEDTNGLLKLILKGTHFREPIDHENIPISYRRKEYMTEEQWNAIHS